MGPENFSAYKLLLTCFSKLGRVEEAINVARDGLAQYPFNPELHHTLGVALAQKEDFVQAARHFVYALSLDANFDEAHKNFRRVLQLIAKTPDGMKTLQEVESFVPDAPVILTEIAWFFATQPDSILRNGSEAVRLAERASALTNRPDPRIFATLAAAYAEAARIPEAIKVAEELRLRARSERDAEMVALSEKLLTGFQKGQAYREEPPKK